MRAIRVGIDGRGLQGSLRTGIGWCFRGRAAVLLYILDHLHDHVAVMQAAGRILSPAYGFGGKPLRRLLTAYLDLGRGSVIRSYKEQDLIDDRPLDTPRKQQVRRREGAR